MYDALASFLTENIGVVIVSIILLCAVFAVFTVAQQYMDGTR